jgi:Zn-dependent alcohol dehydrogenase
MGKPTVEGFALAGTVVQVGADIYTVKMVGPKDEVVAEREKLTAFVKSLRMAE